MEIPVSVVHYLKYVFKKVSLHFRPETSIIHPLPIYLFLRENSNRIISKMNVTQFARIVSSKMRLFKWFSNIVGELSPTRELGVKGLMNSPSMPNRGFITFQLFFIEALYKFHHKVYLAWKCGTENWTHIILRQNQPFLEFLFFTFFMTNELLSTIIVKCKNHDTLIRLFRIFRRPFLDFLQVIILCETAWQ